MNVIIVLCSVVTTIVAAEISDALAIPRRSWGRSPRSLIWRVGPVFGAFGMAMAATGSAWIACLATIALYSAFTVGSNLKHRTLGEPLLFSDLAVLGAFLRYPGFYLGSVPIAVRLIVAGSIVALAATIIIGSTASLTPHLVGLALMLTAPALVALPLRLSWFMDRPDITDDVTKHGLVLTLIVYAWRWRSERRPLVAAPLLPVLSADLVIVVQCESFTDPTTLRADAIPLRSLARSRASAWQRGSLMVSGFGAYTMRTEYGVLFGQNEEALGFRRYDPFLTAGQDASHALPAKLGCEGFRCVFLHPHDLRFYARDRLMPTIGFDRIVGSEFCAPPTLATGPYVSDAAMGAAIHELIVESKEKTFVYAVTMENHGPWEAGRMGAESGGLNGYLCHLFNSDDLLGHLVTTLAASGRSAVLAFFGDHRPSIPGAVEPGGDRHTPYVLMRFEGGKLVMTQKEADLAPADLHHAIVDCAR